MNAQHVSSGSGSHIEATTQVMLTKLTSRTGPPIWFIWTGTDKVRSPGKAEVSAASIVHSTSISTWKEQAIFKSVADGQVGAQQSFFLAQPELLPRNSANYYSLVHALYLTAKKVMTIARCW